MSRPDATLVTIVPPSGYAEELKAAAAAAAAPAEGARCRSRGSALPLRPRPVPLLLPLPAPPRPRPEAARRSNGSLRRASCASSWGSAIRVAKYQGHRHNIGFVVVDEIARRHGFAPWRRRFQGETAEGTLERERVILLKPTTYMNDSGQSVGEAANFFKLGLGDIVVFHDELDLPPAKLRVKVGGGNAGHNGLRSIDAHVGNAFRRVRIGIGHPGVKELVHPYVLNDFAKAERPWVETMVDAIAANAGLIATGQDASFQNKVHLAMQAKGFADDGNGNGEKPVSRRQVEDVMGFKCGIVGLPNVGKSTLFNALTETAAAQAANYPFCTIEPNVGEVAVPDPRLDKLAAIAKSGADHSDPADLRRYRRPRARRIEGRRPRQPVPRQHPRGRCDRACGALL